jgi:hypothetical protein
MAERSSFIIYALVDPETELVRYIGKSSSGLSRPKAHLEPSNLKKHNHRSHWINKLRSKGLAPRIEVLASYPDDSSLSQEEIRYISMYKEAGCVLTNATDGGEGMRGHKQSTETLAKRFSKPARMKMSEAKRGVHRPFSDEHRQKAVLGIKEAWSSQELRQSASVRRGGGPIIEVVSGRSFPSVREAARQLGAHSGCISRVLTGERSQYRGMIFRRPPR